MTGAVRRIGLSASRICGAQRLFRRSSQGPTVLFFHGVEENIIDPAVQGLHFLLGTFERQIRFLRREREVIPIDALCDAVENQRFLDPRCVVLTFDDGYGNNLRLVAPMLKALGLPFTIFVSTRHISEARRFPMYYIRVALLYSEERELPSEALRQTFRIATRQDRLAAIRAIAHAVKTSPLEVVDKIVAECMALMSRGRWADLNGRFESEQPMSWDEVVRTTTLGATIGSHAHDHCILHANQSEAEIRRQVHTSRVEIEKHVGSCRYFAYPNGTADDVCGSAQVAVQSEQFRMAFSTILGEVTPECDSFLAPRIFAVPDYEEFCYLLNRSAEHNADYRAARQSSSLTGTAAAAGSD